MSTHIEAGLEYCGYILYIVRDKPGGNLLEVQIYLDGSYVHSCQSPSLAEGWVNQQIEDQSQGPSQSV